jgi:hypothetical protein
VDGGFPYAIPADNPFAGPTSNTLPEIWSSGWRNPWRFHFDRLTGEMYIGDVGGDQREEINVEPALAGGRNYGWPIEEGDLCATPPGCSNLVPTCGDGSFQSPLHTFSIADTFPQCACVIGGRVYRGNAIPCLQGTYFFANLCFGYIYSFRWDGLQMADFRDRTLEMNPGNPFIPSVAKLTAFGEDGFGEILVVDRDDGEIFRVEPVLSLSVTGSCPGAITVQIDGATPLGKVSLGWSKNLGGFTLLRGHCAGTTVSLKNPTILFKGHTDDLGSKTIQTTAGTSFCGGYIQAMDLETCTVSPAIPFP